MIDCNQNNLSTTRSDVEDTDIYPNDDQLPGRAMVDKQYSQMFYRLNQYFPNCAVLCAQKSTEAVLENLSYKENNYIKICLNNFPFLSKL